METFGIIVLTIILVVGWLVLMPKSKTPKGKRTYGNWQKYGYNEKRDNPQYDKWRAKVKAKYPACIVCNKTYSLEAHHVVPFSVNKWKRYRISNGRMMCASCHSLYHNEYTVKECNLKTLNAFLKKYKGKL